MNFQTDIHKTMTHTHNVNKRGETRNVYNKEERCYTNVCNLV